MLTLYWGVQFQRSSCVGRTEEWAREWGTQLKRTLKSWPSFGRNILCINGHIIVHGWHNLEKLTKCHGSKEDRASYLAKGRYASQSRRHESVLENKVRVCQMKRKGRRTPGNMNKTRRYTVCTCEPGTSEEWPRAQHTNYIEIRRLWNWQQTCKLCQLGHSMSIIPESQNLILCHIGLKF